MCEHAGTHQLGKSTSSNPQTTSLPPPLTLPLLPPFLSNMFISSFSYWSLSLSQSLASSLFFNLSFLLLPIFFFLSPISHFFFLSNLSPLHSISFNFLFTFSFSFLSHLFFISLYLSSFSITPFLSLSSSILPMLSLSSSLSTFLFSPVPWSMRHRYFAEYHVSHAACLGQVTFHHVGSMPQRAMPT